jgi:hypothetical protein
MSVNDSGVPAPDAHFVHSRGVEMIIARDWKRKFVGCGVPENDR